MSTTVHPQVKWAETDDALYVTLEVMNCKSPTVSLTEDTISFKGTGGKKEYACELKLKGKFLPDDAETKWTSNDRQTVFHLMKAEEGRWGRLLENKALQKNLVQADWDRWVDSDAEEDDKKQFDMGDFGGGGMPGMGGGMGGMPGMGGMGGMPGMGGMGGMGGDGGMGGMDMAKLQEMMKGMPGGGAGMPDMGGMGDDGDDDESDDELPDLEEDEAPAK